MDRDKAIRAAKLTTKQVSSHKAADQVADLLRQGRASEVTDDLMAQADPQRLHQHYTSGNTGVDMPMDKASRMARAAQMGFDTGTPLYHGTGADFTGFRPSQSGMQGRGVYATRYPDLASDYTEEAGETGGNVISILSRGGERISATDYGDVVSAEMQKMEDAGRERDWRGALDIATKKMEEKGISGIFAQNSMPGRIDRTPENPHAIGEVQQVIFDPTNIRSQFARFDPRLSHLSHLSASTGGVMELARHATAVGRAGGQVAPSKYMPNVPRAVHADGGKVAFQQGNHPDVPDVLYHGSAPKIATKGWTDEVDEDQTQKNIASQDFRVFKPSDYGNFGPGIYLSDSPKVASDFAQGIRSDQTEAKPHGQVMKLHVSMKQPFHDEYLRIPMWKDYIKSEIKNALFLSPHNPNNIKESSQQLIQKLDDGTATVRDLFLRDTPDGTMINQFGQDKIHNTIRNSGFDGIIAHRPDGTKEYVVFKPEQVKSAIGNNGDFDPTNPDITKADGGKVTDSDNFRNWFGNSVTHTDGQPHVFYTGTSKDKDFTSHNVGRHGAWFTRDPAEASEYAERNDSQGHKI
jgi:hypothetical protein